VSLSDHLQVPSPSVLRSHSHVLYLASPAAAPAAPRLRRPRVARPVLLTGRRASPKSTPRPAQPEPQAEPPARAARPHQHSTVSPHLRCLLLPVVLPSSVRPHSPHATRPVLLSSKPDGARRSSFADFLSLPSVLRIDKTEGSLARMCEKIYVEKLVAEHNRPGGENFSLHNPVRDEGVICQFLSPLATAALDSRCKF
jgi:hypothetical protein